jgi:hypothetical protein
LIFRVFEEEAACSFAQAHVGGSKHRRNQEDSRKHAHGPANAVLGHSSRAHLHVEQMLLTPLAHVGYALIA